MGAYPLRVLAIDPATDAKRVGWASFWSGELIRCGIGFDWRGITVDLLVVEKPQVYSRRTSKGDPNDLIDVAFVAGTCAASVFVVGQLLTPRPHDWKGSVGKAISNRQVLKRLTPTEASLVNNNHNTIDAIGLGLWALKRFP